MRYCLEGTSKRHKESRTTWFKNPWIHFNDLAILLKMTLSNQQLTTLMLHPKKSFGRNQFISPDNQDLFTYQTRLQKFLYEENANMWLVLMSLLIASALHLCLFLYTKNAPSKAAWTPTNSFWFPTICKQFECHFSYSKICRLLICKDTVTTDIPILLLLTVLWVLKLMP